MKPLHMGTHLKVLSKGFQKNTRTRIRWLSKAFAYFSLDESSLSIGRVKTVITEDD